MNTIVQEIKCPVCAAPLTFGQSRCDYCHAGLAWNDNSVSKVDENTYEDQKKSSYDYDKEAALRAADYAAKLEATATELAPQRVYVGRNVGSAVFGSIILSAIISLILTMFGVLVVAADSFTSAFGNFAVLFLPFYLMMYYSQSGYRGPAGFNRDEETNEDEENTDD